jgi:hypothetical protein
MLAGEALAGLKALPTRKLNSFAELDQTLGDIESFAHIGNYYAAKMRAACSLAQFDQLGRRRTVTKQSAIWKKQENIGPNTPKCMAHCINLLVQPCGICEYPGIYYESGSRYPHGKELEARNHQIPGNEYNRSAVQEIVSRRALADY